MQQSCLVRRVASGFVSACALLDGALAARTSVQPTFALGLAVALVGATAGCRSGLESINVTVNEDASTTSSPDGSSSIVDARDSGGDEFTMAMLTPGQMRVVLDSLDAPPSAITYDPAASWSTAAPISGDAGLTRWTIARARFGSDPKEIVALLGAAEQGPQMTLLRLSEGRWSPEWTERLDADIAALETRNADIAFESETGHALAVFSDGSARPKYRYLESGSWSDAEAVPINDGSGPAPDLSADDVRWIRLVPSPAREITLIYADASGAIGAMIWTGSEWDQSTAIVLRDTEASLILQPFDAAYETDSGELLVVWDEVAGFGFASRQAGQPNWTLGTPIDVRDFGVHAVHMSAAPSGDHIALGMADVTGNTRLALATWTGDAWVNERKYDLNIRGGPGDAPVAVAWQTAERAICVYADLDSSELNWATWTAADGWDVQPDAQMPDSMMETESVRLLRTENNTATAIILDAGGLLYGARYDGTTWTELPSTGALGPARLATDSVLFDIYARP